MMATQRTRTTKPLVRATRSPPMQIIVFDYSGGRPMTAGTFNHPPPSPLAALLSKEEPEGKKMGREQEWHNCCREVEGSAERPRLKLNMRPRVKRK